jgi:hypothetical protein
MKAFDAVQEGRSKQFRRVRTPRSSVNPPLALLIRLNASGHASGAQVSEKRIKAARANDALKLLTIEVIDPIEDSPGCG